MSTKEKCFATDISHVLTVVRVTITPTPTVQASMGRISLWSQMLRFLVESTMENDVGELKENVVMHRNPRPYNGDTFKRKMYQRNSKQE